MLAVVLSKWVGDAFGKGGMYPFNICFTHLILYVNMENYWQQSLKFSSGFKTLTMCSVMIATLSWTCTHFWITRKSLRTHLLPKMLQNQGVCATRGEMLWGQNCKIKESNSYVLALLKKRPAWDMVAFIGLYATETFATKIDILHRGWLHGKWFWKRLWQNQSWQSSLRGCVYLVHACCIQKWWTILFLF